MAFGRMEVSRQSLLHKEKIHSRTVFLVEQGKVKDVVVVGDLEGEAVPEWPRGSHQGAHQGQGPSAPPGLSHQGRSTRALLPGLPPGLPPMPSPGLPPGLPLMAQL
jgi:hypothetical protein